MAKCYFEIKSLNYEELKKIVKLPKFQRSIVWSDESRREFIDTVSEGLPFGSLLLYEITDDNYKYQLVDGLQRFSTIQDYEKDKYKYIDLKKIAKSEFDKIFKFYESIAHAELSVSTKEEIEKIISEGFRNYKNNSEYTLPFAVTNRLAKEMSLFNDNKLCMETANIIAKIEQKINSEIDLSILSLPVVIFRGNKSDLPTVFEKINSSGTKLSKYEIFAASWAGLSYKVEDLEILQCVDNKYETMIEKSGISILGYYAGAIKEQREVNLFEYAYAVGKIIRNKCPELFENKDEDASKIDSIGFALLIVCLGGSMKQMDKLPEYFNNNMSEQLVNLKNKIVECSLSVNNTLKKYIISSDNKNYTKYMEAQIVSIIATLFKIRYSVGSDIKITPNDNSGAIAKKFEKHMPKHYLYDMIKGYWGNSGDLKVTELLKLNIQDNKYIKSIDDDNWRITLEEWMTEQETKPSRNINIIQKLFLNYLDKLSAKSATIYSNYTFDIEHIVPLKRLADKFKEGPFSATGNLCLLPSFENRSKKEKTLYEQIDERTILYSLDDNILKQFYYAERSEIDFIKSSSFTREKYISFLHNRHNYLIKSFIELIRKI